MAAPTQQSPESEESNRELLWNTIHLRRGSYPTPSSKYDFVKVKVWLEDHYYVLSRFLVSRVLNVTKVDQGDGVRIALELKKRLVDKGILNLSQAEMEHHLFEILQNYGYGNEYIHRYRMTTKFHHQRVPLIILITGTKCIGKSWLATQLAERMNLSTVLQTNLVYDLMSTIMKDFPIPESIPQPSGSSDTPLVYRDYDDQQLMAAYSQECAMIRHGVDTDIEKCFEEGKAIIIEGYNLDPATFIELVEKRSIPIGGVISPFELQQQVREKDELQEKNKDKQEREKQESTKLEKDAKKEKSKKDYESEDSTPTKGSKEKSKRPQGIIIPFVLSMNEQEHRLLVENWLSCSTRDREFANRLGVGAEEQTTALVKRLQLIQDYLISKVPPFLRVDVNAHAFLDTLDTLHSTVLERIQQVYVGDGFPVQ